MSDFPEPEFHSEIELDKEEPRRKSFLRPAVAVAAIAVIALVVSMLMHLGPFAKDAEELEATPQDPSPVRIEPVCPAGQVVIYNYADPNMTSMCISQDEYERQQDERWATNRQSVIDDNARLQAGIDDLQAQFDAAPTLRSKLSRVLTMFCHSDLHGDIFETVPNENRPSNIELEESGTVTTTPPTSSSGNSPAGSHYNEPYGEGYYSPNPGVSLYGNFDRYAEQLWNDNWDAEAVNFALPASFESAVVQMSCFS